MITVFLVAIDLGFLRDHKTDGYSIIRHLYCVTIKQKEFKHISPNSKHYYSTEDYNYIYHCGNEYEESFTAN